VIEWLVSKGANLNIKGRPAIVAAGGSSSVKVVELLLKNGADVNAVDSVGKTAMGSALYNKRYELLALLIANGYRILEDGISLRQAVADRQYRAVDLFLAAGLDVNLHKANMVYPYNPTAVMTAATNNDLKMVQLLIQHGADVTIKDKYGERPFNAAVQHKNSEMMALIKSLEPEAWHNEEQRIADLKSYKIPAELLAILRSDNRRMELPDCKEVSYIEFNSLLNVKEVNWEKRKFIDLLSKVDNYGADGFLVWYPKKKCLAFADYEHVEFRELCTVKEFLQHPGIQIDKIFE
jgi:predicted Fe-Mo cluster-binding NifX family protein